MLKHLGPIARKTLLKIFNHSWNKGLVPEVWKNSTSCPSFKERKGQGQPKQLSSNQLTQLRGEAREACHHLSSHLVPGDQQHIQPLTDRVPSTSQHWRSACTPLSRYWKLLPREAQAARSLFDLSKAFNRVWKKGLQWKLLKTGVSGQMYIWISSFLYHRMARLKLDGSLSREIRLKERVPQGSVLSLTLFLLYVSDIVNTLPPRVTNSLHADDLAAWTSAEHTSTATRHARDHQQSELLGRWVVHGNQLQKNTSNTLLTLHCERESDAEAGRHASATSRQSNLPRSHSGHASQVENTSGNSCGKIREKASLIQKLACTTWGADTNILRRIYTGAVRPIMEYVTTPWATASNANKSKLDKVQNVALRVIVGAMKTTTIKEMEKRADLEPLELRRTFKVLTQTEKIRRLPGHPLHRKLLQKKTQKNKQTNKQTKKTKTKKQQQTNKQEKKAEKTEPQPLGQGPQENSWRYSGSTDQWGKPL